MCNWFLISLHFHIFLLWITKRTSDVFPRQIHIVFDAEKSVNEYTYSLENFFVKKQTNWIDVLEAFAQNSSNIMPILDTDNTYLGYYELNDIIGVFNDTPFLHELGSVLVVEKGIQRLFFQ